MDDRSLKRMRFWNRVRSKGATIGGRILATTVRALAFLAWPVRANLISQTGHNLRCVFHVKGSRAPFKVVCLNNIMVERARNTTYKERGTCDWIDAIPAGSVLWDIGANIGMFTLYAASRADLRILAFEPHPGNYYSLCSSIIANGYSTRCAVYPLALYERAFLGSFNYHSVDIGSACNVFDKTKDNQGKDFVPAASMAAMGMTIDSFVNDWGAPAPEYIKLDVDGNELSILKGARQVLARSVREVVVETSEGLAESSTLIHNLLREAGFEECGRESFGNSVYNCHFVRRHPATTPAIETPARGASTRKANPAR